MTDFSWQRDGRPAPWDSEHGPNDGSPFKGRRFVEFNVYKDSLSAKLDNGQVLELSPDSGDRLPLADGEPRAIGDDDLRRLVFLSPTHELWIE